MNARILALVAYSAFTFGGMIYFLATGHYIEALLAFGIYAVGSILLASLID